MQRGVRRFCSALCTCAGVWALTTPSAGATPLTTGTVPVRFALKRGFHLRPSTRVLALVFRETYGGCEQPPQFAGYTLFWEPHRLTVTLLVRPLGLPPSNTPCPLVAYVKYVGERVTLPRALGARKLLDGATHPPRLVGAGRGH
jgi:hypothetical protein